MTYKHGTYGDFAKSIARNAESSPTTAVYVGTAPVNLVLGYAEKNVVNAPILLQSYRDAYDNVGYSGDWNSFTICEAIKTHFDNPSGNIGGIVVINVLDPAIHKKASATTRTLTFVNGKAVFESDTIILDSLVLADKVKDVDFSVSYNFEAKRVVIDSIGTKLTGNVEATYSEIDTAAVTAEIIIGEATNDGSYKGLGALELVNQTLNRIPNLIVAPKWSAIPEVYEAMIDASSKINGHWDAFVLADIPITDEGKKIDTIDAALKWATDHGYNSERTKVCWPMATLVSGDIVHTSTLNAWAMLHVDATHNGIPMETPSNISVPVAKQYFGVESTNRGFDQFRANALNEKGISTVVYFGGRWVLWGNHTAAYAYGNVEDNRVIFDNNVRMMMYISNSFQKDWATTIDAPMTLAMSDTIKQREQEKADALAAIGALIGTPVVIFDKTSNVEGELIEGNFVWDFVGTPTPPMKSATLRVAYSTEGFSAYFGEEV